MTGPPERPRWLYSNQLTRVPVEMGRLTNLKRLWMDHNQLQELPEGLFGGLSNLQVGVGRLHTDQSSHSASER